MLFQSPEFLVFLVVIISLIAVISHHRARVVFFVLISWFFYGWWNVRLVPLLWSFTLIGWSIGVALQAVSDEGKRRVILWLGIGTVLTVLGFFKYTNFILANLAPFTGHVAPRYGIILPIGISFIVFELISYMVDVYDRKISACGNIVDFAMFNAFFPRLISGPIIRAADFLPQLETAPRLSRDGMVLGIQIFIIGMFQKTVIADNIAPFVDTIYNDPLLYTSATLWLTVFAYSAQIFCDFSGYTLMAIGLARMFGFLLPPNFNYPYLARSAREFWQRWHISLSLWLRDYLYIKLGGDRHGRPNTWRNLMVTMLLGGLWHGAGWNFVAWGGFHGSALVAENAARSGSTGEATPSPVRRAFIVALGWLVTFAFVSLLWIPFRSPSVGAAYTFLHGLVHAGSVSWFPPQTLCVLGVLVAIHLLQFDRLASLRILPCLRPFRLMPFFCLSLLVWSIIVFAPVNISPFIYFQF